MKQQVNKNIPPLAQQVWSNKSSGLYLSTNRWYTIPGSPAFFSWWEITAEQRGLWRPNGKYKYGGGIVAPSGAVYCFPSDVAWLRNRSLKVPQSLLVPAAVSTLPGAWSLYIPVCGRVDSKLS